MHVITADSLKSTDLQRRDLSFKISSRVAKPYTNLASVTSPSDILTTPVPEYTKSYGGVDEHFTAAQDASHKVTLALVDESGDVYGYAMAFKDWNNMVTLHDFAVSGELRGRGYGKMLFDRVVEWARGLGVKGVRIETQDVNVAACRFYLGRGAVFGGYDEYLYRGTGGAGETALYWYYLLD
jgi:streptothricin acetyltransferase